MALFRRTSTVSLRWSLLRSFIVLILLSSVIVLGLSWFRALETERALSSRLIRRGTTESRDALDRFLRPADVGTRIGLAWGRAGLLRLDGATAGAANTAAPDRAAEVRRLNGLLLPYLRANPALSSVQVATSRGEGFLVLLLPGGAIQNRVVDRRDWGKRTLWFDVDADGRPSSPEWKDVDYEPRERSWYVEAMATEKGTVAWTEPYTFYTTGDLGITSSGRWEDGDGTSVIAYDVLLTALTEFTQSATGRVSPNALKLIATSDWKLLGVPAATGCKDPAAAKALFLQSVKDLCVPAIQGAVRAFSGRPAATSEVLSYDADGQTWWAGVETYPLGERRHVWTAVLVPGRDLLAEVAQQREYLLIATGIALGAALLYSLLLARSYSRPLEALARQSTRIRNLDFRFDETVDAPLEEIRALAVAQQQSLAVLQSFSRYVPVDVVRELVSEGEIARIGGRTRTLTILFSDIAGFTTIAEGMQPQALADHMAEYFEAMIDAIQAEGGTVDKLVGDAIVAFWGAPRPLEDHAAHGVRAVLACRERLGRLEEEWGTRGLPPLPTRFGLASGPVVVGNIGAPSRLAYTVLGDTVNFASRLEGLNKRYFTMDLADRAVVEATGSAFVWRRVDRVVVKGRTGERWIYELLGRSGDVLDDVVARARLYETAWDLHAGRRFDEAVSALEALLEEGPGDGAALRLLALCRGYLANPPDADWTATTRMTDK